MPAGGSLRLIVRTDGAARAIPGRLRRGAVLIDAAKPGRPRPARPTDRHDQRVPRDPDEQRRRVRRGGPGAGASPLELGATEVDLLLDSKLIVEQVNGRWRVKDLKIAPLHAEVRASLARFRRWTANHVPRAQNSAADALANEAIDRVRAGGPPLVVRRPGP